jgi:quercetin dioxygenase-like cupin family protein
MTEARMDEMMKAWEGTPFPEMIRNLPAIESPVPGVRGWLLQGPRSQAVFFDIEAGIRIPPHTHCAQWGIVVEGEISLTIGGLTRVYRKGEWYYIPAGTPHAADFPARVNVIDVFDDPARYRPKA